MYASALVLLSMACLVPRKDYDALQADLNALQVEMSGQIEERDAQILTLEEAIALEKEGVASLSGQRAQLQSDLETANAAQAALIKDRSRLRASVADMETALNELAERKRAAEQRIAQYQDLLSRFQTLIDAGRLSVQIVDGRMVVALATDILFASGKAELSEDGTAALTEVASILAGIPDRNYQVEGHTDDVPIRTEQYPSNWELAAGRSIAVVKTLIEGGLPEDRVSAASFSKHKPVATNDDADGRALNRRIEIVVVPDLSDLPGFDELNAISGASE
jgi:chemotaxis protein MotB